MSLLQHSVSADGPLVGFQLTNPILKGTVRVLRATALPDCLNEKVLAQLAPIYRRLDQTLYSINVNAPKIGVSHIMGNINVIQNSIQNILNANALDIQNAPKKWISCDANIPSNVQALVNKLHVQFTELERKLAVVDNAFRTLVANNLTASTSQRILIVDNIFKQLIPVRLIGSHRKGPTISNYICFSFSVLWFLGNCCRYR